MDVASLNVKIIGELPKVYFGGHIIYMNVPLKKKRVALVLTP